MKYTILISLFAALAAASPEQLLEENSRLEAENRRLETEWAEAANANTRRIREEKNLTAVINQQKEIIAQLKEPCEKPSPSISVKVKAPEPKRIQIPLPRPKQAFASLENADGAPTLTVNYPEPIEKVNPIVQIHLKKEELAGKKVTFTAEIAAENLSKPAAHHHGGRFGLYLTDNAGKASWPAAQIGGGSFSWKTVSFTAEIPHGAKAVTLLLGVQGVTGKISFRNLSAEFME